MICIAALRSWVHAEKRGLFFNSRFICVASDWQIVVVPSNIREKQRRYRCHRVLFAAQYLNRDDSRLLQAGVVKTGVRNNSSSARDGQLTLSVCLLKETPQRN